MEEKQEKEKGNQRDKRILQGSGVRQEGALQRPLKLTVHGRQEPDEKVNECQGQEGSQAGMPWCFHKREKGWEWQGGRRGRQHLHAAHTSVRTA